MKRTINFVTLWSRLLTASLRKDSSEFNETRNYNFYADTTAICSGRDYVSFLFTIDGYPRELAISYRKTLREEVIGSTRVSFVTPLERHTIEWESSRMKARLNTWRVVDDEIESVDEYNLHDNVTIMDNQSWRKDSLVYLSLADMRRHRKMFECRTLMIISGERGDDFNQTVARVLGMCRTLNIKYSRVQYDIPNFLGMFSPFSNKYDPDVKKACGTVVLPDEIIARFNSCEQGQIGKMGIYWGTDIYSNFPCLKKPKRTSVDAENWLITAETGGGKSYFVKVLLLQMLAQPNYNGTVMDIEGFEYIPLAKKLNEGLEDGNKDAIVINMGEGTGVYFDPMEIYLTGDDELDDDMYDLSYSFTLALFKCLLGVEKTDTWLDAVITDAVSATYANAGVLGTDKSTWHNTEKLSIFNVYETLKNLKTSKGAAGGQNFSQSIYASVVEEKQSYTSDITRLVSANESYQNAIDIALAKLGKYFEKIGGNAGLFRKKINMSKLINTKLVVCSFGMAGKSEKSVDATQMALTQLYAANISHIRSIFSKHAGKFNFKLWEEFQRWGGFPDADKTINVALTGGRKLGDINIIVTNKVAELLDTDRFGIFSNITTLAVGAIGDSMVRRELCQRMSIEMMQPELDAIASHNNNLGDYLRGDTLSNNPYSKAFLIGLDRTAYTIAKMTLPAFLAKSKLFETGVDAK